MLHDLIKIWPKLAAGVLNNWLDGQTSHIAHRNTALLYIT